MSFFAHLVLIAALLAGAPDAARERSRQLASQGAWTPADVQQLLQVKKGEGPYFDYLHLQYSNSATVLAMGMPMIDAIRQMAMTATDPNSRGRNFPGHFARREWNIIPVSSVIENQFVIAPGTAWVQKCHGGDGITIVVGGDAGSHEGDFASCMIWSTH